LSHPNLSKTWAWEAIGMGLGTPTLGATIVIYANPQPLFGRIREKRSKRKRPLLLKKGKNGTFCFFILSTKQKG